MQQDTYVTVVPYTNPEFPEVRWSLKFSPGGGPGAAFSYALRENAEQMARMFNARFHIAYCVRHWKAHGVWPSED